MVKSHVIILLVTEGPNVGVQCDQIVFCAFQSFL